jgi:formyltetrahydrofolate deformylase
MPGIRAVVSVVGDDQKGVVARFATYLAERGINIEDIEQQVVHGRFVMDMLVDFAEMTSSLDQVITELLELGESIGMQVRVTLHDQRRTKRVAVLVSKEPHCLDHLLEAREDGLLRGEIVGVLSNHPDLEPRAAEAGLPYEHFPATDKAAHFAWLKQRLAAMEPDLVVLARYMQVLPAEIVRDYPSRIINIHPSLLPYFPGARPYRQAWESGVRVSGCTAHFVTEELDAGPVILQDVFHIEVGRDSAEDVQRKGRALEGAVLSKAVQTFLDEQLLVIDGKVVFRPGLSSLLGAGRTQDPE